MTATGGTALTTTMGVVDRVHGHTANSGAHTAPTRRTGLTQLAQAVLRIGDLTQGGAAVRQHLAHLARAQTQRGVLALARHQLHGCPGGASHLGTLAGLQLDGVDHGTHRDIAQGQAITGLDRRG